MQSRKVFEQTLGTAAAEMFYRAEALLNAQPAVPGNNKLNALCKIFRLRDLDISYLV